MKNYIKENIPKKSYKYKIRPRRPGEIFIGEILFALFLIFMLVMLYLNYESNLKYQVEKNITKKEINEIDVNIEINTKHNTNINKDIDKYLNLKNTNEFIFL